MIKSDDPQLFLYEDIVVNNPAFIGILEKYSTPILPSETKDSLYGGKLDSVTIQVGNNVLLNPLTHNAFLSDVSFLQKIGIMLVHAVMSGYTQRMITPVNMITTNHPSFQLACAFINNHPNQKIENVKSENIKFIETLTKSIQPSHRSGNMVTSVNTDIETATKFNKEINLLRVKFSFLPYMSYEKFLGYVMELKKLIEDTLILFNSYLKSKFDIMDKLVNLSKSWNKLSPNPSETATNNISPFGVGCSLNGIGVYFLFDKNTKFDTTNQIRDIIDYYENLLCDINSVLKLVPETYEIKIPESGYMKCEPGKYLKTLSSGLGVCFPKNPSKIEKSDIMSKINPVESLMTSDRMRYSLLSRLTDKLHIGWTDFIKLRSKLGQRGNQNDTFQNNSLVNEISSMIDPTREKSEIIKQIVALDSTKHNDPNDIVKHLATDILKKSYNLIPTKELIDYITTLPDNQVEKLDTVLRVNLPTLTSQKMTTMMI